VNQIKNIDKLFESRNLEGVVRVADQQLHHLKTTTASDPIVQRAMFEIARGIALHELGREEEAIKSYRSILNDLLSFVEPTPSGVALVITCFDKLSELLISRGSYSEAVTVRRREVEFIRSMVDEHPEFRAQEVQGLSALGRSLTRAGNGVGALLVLQDAHSLLQEIQSPSTTRIIELTTDVHKLKPDINELTTDITVAMVVAYQMLNRWSEALPLSERLVEKGSGTFKAAEQSGTLNDKLEDSYAYVLCRHADNLWNVGRTEESLATHEQAISIFRRLYERNPGEQSSELAKSMYNYSIRQAPQKQFILMKEGLDLLRGQSVEEDCLRIPYLMSMSKLLCEEGLDGVKEAREAVEIADRLAAREPTVHWKSRVEAREKFGLALVAAHQQEKGFGVLKEMIKIHRAHVPRSDAMLNDVTGLVDNLGQISWLVLLMTKQKAIHSHW
jgi:tetratricopeptide (TPR) repeat protein